MIAEKNVNYEKRSLKTEKRVKEFLKERKLSEDRQKTQISSKHCEKIRKFFQRIATTNISTKDCRKKCDLCQMLKKMLTKDR